MDLPAPLHVLSLCSGLGGLELGLRLAVPAARAVCYVEVEAYACAVLAARMEEGILAPAPVWTDLRTFDGRPWRGVVDLVAAGYPCQPFSHAGKRGGAADERHLWPHVARVVGEVEPVLVFLENVAGHLSLGFDRVVADLHGLGYEVAAGLFTAEEVGAPHRRERLFALGYAGRRGQDRLQSVAESWGGGPSPLGEAGGDSPRGTRREPETSDSSVLVVDPVGARRPPAGPGGPEQPRQEPEEGGRVLADRLEGGRGEDLVGVLPAGPEEPNTDRRGAAALGDPGSAGLPDGTPGCLAAQTPAPWPPSPSDRDAWAFVLSRRPDLAPALADRQDGQRRLPVPAGRPDEANAEPDGRGEGDGGRKGAAEPAVRGMAARTPDRVERLRALGNAVVPVVAAHAFRKMATVILRGRP